MKKVMAMVFSILATVVHAATLDSKEAAKELTDQVMAKVGAGDIEGGLILMKPYSIIPESEFTTMIEQTKLQLPMIQGRFGKIVGSEFIKEKSAGNSLLQVVHIQKFEKHIMRWNFTFYCPGEKWVLNTFNFDDKITLMFDE